MATGYAKIRELERRFAHLARSEMGEAIVYRTGVGRELFRLEGRGNRLRVPVSLEVLQSLFGNPPFAVEPFGDSCVIPLDEVRDEVLLWTLLEALGEQTVDTNDEIRMKDPVDVIEEAFDTFDEASEIQTCRTPEPSEIAGARHHIPVQLLTRFIAAGVIILLAGFLALSIIIGEKSKQSDVQFSIEETFRP